MAAEDGTVFLLAECSLKVQGSLFEKKGPNSMPRILQRKRVHLMSQVPVRASIYAEGPVSVFGEPLLLRDGGTVVVVLSHSSSGPS